VPGPQPHTAGNGNTTMPNEHSASWFGAPGPEAASWLDPALVDTQFQEPGLAAERRIRSSRASRSDASGAPPVTPFYRIYRAFLTARAALALLLLSLVGLAWLLGNRPPLWMSAAACVYVAATFALRLWPIGPRMRTQPHQTLHPRQMAATVGLDLVCFGALHVITGSTINSQALFVLPVLMAAVLMPRLLALGVAAVATLTLLGAALLESTVGGSLPTLMTQAGMAGFGLFAITVLANELSTRLAKEERSARGSLEMARQQAQLNRMVIDEMSEGVLVVDRQGRVRTANPAARRLLSAQGLLPPAPFQLNGVPAWKALIQAVERARNSLRRAEEGQEVKLDFDDQSQRDVRLRVRFTRGRGGRTAEDICVMFLEDLRTVRSRQRQDKLAAMGRMSAGIAHEIRNPLAAIAQANALMSEDAATPTQKRLTQMVSDNVARLKHIVDDILAVAPGLRPPAPLVDPLESIVAMVNEWRSTQGLSTGEASILDVDTRGCQRAPTYPVLKIRFEPEHLQRVLVNLLDNALRYNSGEPGAIVVAMRWMPSADPTGMLMVSVSNDGEPVSPDTERSLFEPFFSTSSRGTGLGLYICRELCERHGASIDYRLHPPPVRHRNEFFITVPLETVTPPPSAP